MYMMLARFGYGVGKGIAKIGYKTARAIRPEKVKKLLQPVYQGVKTPRMQGSAKLSKFGQDMARGGEGAFKKGYKGYQSLYKTTLGDSTRRRITGGTVGGYALGSFIDDDD
ncbi:MAG: hypothetical protein O3A39_06750 [Proteobacteria bacterium]|nr:hypothetical protein [Pseudomonadota bacterium]